MFKSHKIELWMSPAKNLVLEIENTYLKPLFKHILIFEKKLARNRNFEFWIFHVIFTHAPDWLRSKYAKFVYFASFGLKVAQGRYNY